MAGLADIPDHLLTIEKVDDFLKWCNDQPMSREDKLALAALWQRFTGAKLTADHWKKLE